MEKEGTAEELAEMLFDDFEPSERERDISTRFADRKMCQLRGCDRSSLHFKHNRTSFLAGYRTAMAEAEARERAAWSAARSTHMPWTSSPYSYKTFEEWKAYQAAQKQRGQG